VVENNTQTLGFPPFLGFHSGFLGLFPGFLGFQIHSNHPRRAIMTSMAALNRAILLTLAALTVTQAQTFPATLLHDLHWRNIGPFRGGRTRAAAGVPTQPNVFYIGVTNGGVWKSDDYGHTWAPIFDSQPTQSIGAIAVAPSDPNTLYVASGEGLQRPDLSVGNGIYKSTDAGQTWTHLGLRDGQQIPALAVDPRDKNHLYAAVLGHPYGPNPERGVFQSTDGGQTWTKSLFIDENTGASDIALDLSNPDTLYAALWEGRQGPWEFGNGYNGAHGGAYKSTDAGRTWNKLTQGLPADASQTCFTISLSNPRRLYASVASGTGVEIYRTDDAGASWTATTTDPRPKGRIGGGDLPVPRVDPQNPDTLYMTSTVTWRSTDAGKTWTGIKGAPGGDDYQNMWINPLHPEIILLVADQGAVVTVNGGRTWSSWYNQPTAQMYHAIATNDFPYRVCGGQQESGSVCVSSRGNDGAITFRDWHPVGIIEYGYAAPDPLNPDLVYGAGRGSVTKYRWSTSQVQHITPSPLRDPKYRTDRTSPLIFSPVAPHVLFYAANYVFKTLDGGQTWQSISGDLTRDKNGIPASLGTMAAKDANAEKQRGTIYSLAPSFKSVNTLWAGTDEGLIWVTKDGGAHWKDVTPPELTSWSKVTQLEAGHFDDQTAYASVSRFRVDDLKPRLYRTHDGGKTWQSIVNGLPDDSPVNTVREDPVRKGLLFAGTENAVWVSFDDGDHWQSLQLNLPHTSMRDLWIKDADLIVATHGRSFWILDDITPLRQLNAKALTEAAFLVKPARATRVRANTNTDTPLPPEEPLADNPPDGAVIDYHLKETAAVVKLEILDAAGKVVRRFSSDDQPFSLKNLAVPDYWPERPQTLSRESGMHRWVWDLHYTGPETERHTYPIAAVPHHTPRLPQGPMALPGVYTVKLTVGTQSYAAPLTVRMDPRVKANLLPLFNAQVKLVNLISETHEDGRVAAKVVSQNPPDVQKSRDALTALTRVNGQMLALYNDLAAVDALPTAAQAAAVTKLAADATTALARWDAIRKALPSTINLIPDKEENEDDAEDDDIG
jgi:photosystem II stability/assembly factor-like uncharacterized protein